MRSILQDYFSTPPLAEHMEVTHTQKGRKKKESASVEDVRYYFHTDIGGRREEIGTIQWDRGDNNQKNR